MQHLVRVASRLSVVGVRHSKRPTQALVLSLYRTSQRQFATDIKEQQKAHGAAGTTQKLAEITFTDNKSTFAAVKTMDLIKSGIMFTSLRFTIVYQNIGTLLNLATKMFGKPLVYFIVRHSLFRQFSGGEDLEELLVTGKKLAARNLGTIVDYAAESEVTSDSGPSEAWLDSNVNLTKDGIYNSRVLATDRGLDFAFLAYKVTSMCPPELCQRVNKYLNLMHSLYDVAVGVSPESCISTLNPYHHDILAATDLPKDKAVAFIKSLWPSLTDEGAQDCVDKISQEKGGPKTDGDNNISYFQWVNYFTPERALTLEAPTITSNKQLSKDLEDKIWLTTEDLATWKRAAERYLECFEYAVDQKVRLLVDAEQTSVQSCIDYVYLKAAEKYCTLPEGSDGMDGDAYIYNTYQLYLKNSLGKLKADAERADRMGYKFGAKIVRGAYINHETKESSALKIECLVHDNLQNTEKSYNAAVDFLFDALPKYEVLCGTHNEKATQRAARKLGVLSNNDPMKYPVTFGQLYGMCDYLSLQLGKLGCRAYKYVPYGALNLVLPYLIRRAEENSSVVGNAKKEAKLIWAEVRRRVF